MLVGGSFPSPAATVPILRFVSGNGVKYEGSEVFHASYSKSKDLNGGREREHTSTSPMYRATSRRHAFRLFACASSNLAALFALASWPEGSGSICFCPVKGMLVDKGRVS